MTRARVAQRSGSSNSSSRIYRSASPFRRHSWQRPQAASSRWPVITRASSRARSATNGSAARLIPGAGGTQHKPRLSGFPCLEMCIVGWCRRRGGRRHHRPGDSGNWRRAPVICRSRDGPEQASARRTRELKTPATPPRRMRRARAPRAARTRTLARAPFAAIDFHQGRRHAVLR